MQGRALKFENIALEKEKVRLEKESENWQSRAHVAEVEASSYKKMCTNMANKNKAEFRTVVDSYMQSNIFLQFIDDHDDQMRPVNMTLG